MHPYLQKMVSYINKLSCSAFWCVFFFFILHTLSWMATLYTWAEGVKLLTILLRVKFKVYFSDFLIRLIVIRKTSTSWMCVEREGNTRPLLWTALYSGKELCCKYQCSTWYWPTHLQQMHAWYKVRLIPLILDPIEKFIAIDYSYIK